MHCMINYEKLIKATNIFNLLLENGQVDVNENVEVYEALLDEDTNEILNTLANTSKLIIRRIDKYLYILPSMDNNLYGFKEKEIKERLFSGATKVDYYLFNYIILVILNKFYSSGGDNPKLLQHISINDLMKIISVSLKDSEGEDKSKDEKYDINFKLISDKWEGLLIVDETSKGSLKTKRGFLLRVFKFLQEEELIRYYEDEDIIMTTKRCDDLMKNFFLSYERKELITRFFNTKGGMNNADN